MQTCSSHEKLAIHIYRATYTPIHPYIDTCMHTLIYSDTGSYIHEHRCTRIGNWANSVEGGPEWVLSPGIGLCTTLDGLGQCKQLTFLPCSLPCFWNEPYILEPVPNNEDGRISVLQLELAPQKRKLLNFGSIHSVCYHWCSQWCLWKEGVGAAERERKRKKKGKVESKAERGSVSNDVFWFTKEIGFWFVPPPPLPRL